MAQFIIEGGQHLKGEIEVMGMKNAATPILAATLLTKEPCCLKNVPNISDVRAVLDIIKSLGGRVENIDEHTLNISNKNIIVSIMMKVFCCPYSIGVFTIPIRYP